MFSASCCLISLIILSLSLFKAPLLHLLFIHIPISLCSIGIMTPLSSTEPFWSSFIEHIVLFFLSLSILALSGVQGGLLLIQNYCLRMSYTPKWLQKFPPLQTMEELFFKISWAGFIILSASILSIIRQYQIIDLAAFKFKILLTGCAWLLYMSLVLGRALYGLRGRLAVTINLLGIVSLATAYVSSRLSYLAFL